MDRKDMHKENQCSISKQLQLNVKLFNVINKSNISTKEKVKKVKKLLGKNPHPDINAQDGNENRSTALHLAIKRNELEVVNYLLTQGADTTIENGDGKTPIHLAEEHNHIEIIEALKSFTSPIEWHPSETGRLASHTSQPVAANHNQMSVFHSESHAAAIGKQTASSVLPPFSGELKVDKKLKLSHDNFKKSIKDFYGKKQLSAIDQLKATPPYLMPHVLAKFAAMAYCDCIPGEPNPPEGWKLLTTASNCGNSYFGTAYWHPAHQQVVIAHRGTETNNVVALFKDFYTDIVGISLNKYVKQMSSASTFANKVVSVLQEIEQEKRVCFELFSTGHSLGGWLAQITAFTTEYLEVKGGKFLKRLPREEQEPFSSNTVQESYDVRQRFHPHTVVFDSPGCKDMLSQMADKLDVRHKGCSTDLWHLDITSYLSAPNRINTCNAHLGTIYRIFTDLSDMGWKEKHTPLYNLATHSMDKIVQAFDPQTGQVHKDPEGRMKVREVVDWPVSTGIMCGAELNDFFKWAQHLKNYHSEVVDSVPSNVPKGYHTLRYQTKAYDECTKCLRVFNRAEREFLERYICLRNMSDFFKSEDLFSVMNNTEAIEEAEQKLQKFELHSESVRCPDTNNLHTLIPYVKRLLRLFPQIKGNIKSKLTSSEIRNRVYQNITQRYVAKIRQNALDFKPEALGLKEFLTSDKQVWQLRMVDGDAWTGITKVYRVLQSTSCAPNYSSDGQYTVLKLKRLITVNRMINLNALLTSMEKPHLLMIACENNQQSSDELKAIFKELFSILKPKKSMKIILTTHSDESTATFLEQIARKALGEGFMTKDEHLSWSDLTSNSQKEILKKKVIFQGRRFTLNQLTSAESMTDSFPLADLLQEKELRIGEEPVLSACSGYNEKYYIDRTFNHNIVIKQDISRDKKKGKFDDLLASTEQEFKNLCQQNPKENVHWLEKHKSGEFIWRQSQGNLKTLRRYIDKHSSHSYAPSDLDNLLQEATHQRIMLIADTAGMGKSTVLTHLSERIRQKFPAHWLVRCDLNDYTQQLKAHKRNKMDKERVLEFLSKEVLKLEAHLQKMFKKNFEENEFNKVVVMVDGFDEISPYYKETVIDMLLVLKQTSLEQLWVTTRPHLRDDLEDTVQQLSYTLQPFSEVEQVEFLKNFWFQNSNLEDKDEHRLQIYAEALIRKLSQSISDEDREFTGIPLQTRMLAEAFEDGFRSFFLSEKSEPELPHKLDLLGLYGRFIDSKYDIFFNEKSKFQPGNMGAERIREHELKNIQVEHQLLALEALFTEEHYTFLQIQRHSIFSDEDLARIGIAQRNNEGKPHFIHRTFAEYFVAGVLINQLTKKTKFHVQEKKLLLNEVLVRKDCNVIRAFLNGLLEKSKPSTEALKEYGDLLDEQWNKGEEQGSLIIDTTALHVAAEENNSGIIEFLLDSLKSGEHSNALRVMLLAKDYCRRTAWHVAEKEGHIKAVELLWIWAKAQLNPLELAKEFLLGKDREKRNAWHWAAELGSVQILVKLWDWAKEVHIKPEELRNEVLWARDKDIQTAWHVAAESGHVEVLEKLWEWAKELKLTPEALRYRVLLLKKELNETAWHMAANRGHVELLEKLWEWAKELQLTPEELKNEVLLSTSIFHFTAWYKAAGKGHVEVLEKLWEWAKELQIKPEEIRNGVLLSKDELNNTPWHKAAGNGHVEVLDRMWDWAKELQLKPEELKNEVLLSKDNYRITAWGMAAEGSHVEILQKLWNLAKELQLKPQELRDQVWLSNVRSGETAWLLAAKVGHVKLLEKLWDLAKELQLTPQELRDQVWLSKIKPGETAWFLAAKRGHVDLLQKLWDCAKELQLTPQELRDQVWLSKYASGETAWLMAARQGHVNLLQKLWDWAKELQLTPHELKDRLWLTNVKAEETAWFFAARGGHVKLLEKLWDLAKQLHLTPQELRDHVWLSKAKPGETAWLLAARRGHVKILQKLWDWAKELPLAPHELRDQVWLSKVTSGETAWLMAARGGHVHLLQKLWDWAKELQLTPPELWDQLWLSKVKSGETAWLMAARGGHIKILRMLWDWAKELQLTPHKLKDQVWWSKDKFGETAWLIAARRGHIKLFQKLWDWAKELQLTPQELRDQVWLTKVKAEETAWFLATRRGHDKLLEKLWDLAKELHLTP